MTTIDRSLSDEDALRKLQALHEYVDRFWQAFWHRPGMLGMPRDVEAMFHHIDWIEHLLAGGGPERPNDITWTEFLIRRKYIRGAAHLLRESLRDDLDDFPKLQALRREYLAWREQHGAGPSPP